MEGQTCNHFGEEGKLRMVGMPSEEETASVLLLGVEIKQQRKGL